MGIEFEFAPPPKIIFGAGKIDILGGVLSRIGRNVLLVTSPGFPERAEKWDALLDDFERRKLNVFHRMVSGEPSPETVDSAVADFGRHHINVVAALGGGSVIDSGKAISAMLPLGKPVTDYLELVGTGARHNGVKVPFVAAPTTAGTGAEATKNAVISRVGPGGFKRSLRHDNLVPDVALIDPELAATCSRATAAACGMDAFSQLLEAYVSTKSNPLTDAAAISGLEKIGTGLERVCGEKERNADALADMAYAALMSGIVLANAGLGVVHGLAAEIGGAFDVPHGVVCGTLMAAANDITVEKIISVCGPRDAFVIKYARAARAVFGIDEPDPAGAARLLVGKLSELTESLGIPRLGAFGVTEAEVERLAAATGCKNNPIELDADEIAEIIRRGL